MDSRETRRPMKPSKRATRSSGGHAAGRGNSQPPGSHRDLYTIVGHCQSCHAQLASYSNFMDGKHSRCVSNLCLCAPDIGYHNNALSCCCDSGSVGLQDHQHAGSTTAGPSGYATSATSTQEHQSGGLTAYVDPMSTQTHQIPSPFATAPWFDDQSQYLVSSAQGYHSPYDVTNINGDAAVSNNWEALGYNCIQNPWQSQSDHDTQHVGAQFYGVDLWHGSGVMVDGQDLPIEGELFDFVGDDVSHAPSHPSRQEHQSGN